jgi:hypothetical protein
MVRLVGESYTETQAYAFQAAADEGRSFVAPYDDPLTIAGQGTIGAEILKQLGSQVDKLDAIFVAIGGGGLIAGIAAYVRALKPSIKIIGVEPSGANCMAQSLAAGRRVQLSRVDAFADGVAVKSVGAVRFHEQWVVLCKTQISFQLLGFRSEWISATGFGGYCKLVASHTSITLFAVAAWTSIGSYMSAGDVQAMSDALRWGGPG